MKVSIVCVTYNQVNFLPRAIGSFVGQKTTFPFEIILADDCSTDGTNLVCERYAELYPDIIKYLRSQKNAGGVENERRAIEVAQGEYIAVCEGDDYWVDSKKLQKQVDFLDSHPDYSVTWTRYEKYVQSNEVYLSDGNSDLFSGGKEYVDITTHMFLHRWMTQYLTMVFRRTAYDNSWCNKYRYFRDSHQFYHLLQNGKGAILNFIGGVYRQTGEGIYSDLDHLRRQEMQIAVFKELWKVNNDDDAKSMYMLNTRYLLELMQKAKVPKKEQYKYALRLFVASRDLKGLLSNIKKIGNNE